jgi:hypothetical protein
MFINWGQVPLIYGDGYAIYKVLIVNKNNHGNRKI